VKKCQKTAGSRGMTFTPTVYITQVNWWRWVFKNFE